MGSSLTGYKLFFQDLCINEPIIPSDTLYGMILDSLYMLKVIPDDSAPELDFSISSAFPFYQDYHFFPIPIDFHNKFPNRYAGCQNMLFISKHLLQSYFSDTTSKEEIYQSGCFLAEDKHPIHMVHPIYKAVRFPVYSENDCHPLKTTQFRKDAGLYFFVRTESDNGKKQVKTALDFLKDQGMGKKRHSGRGSFEFTEFQMELSIESRKKNILLSMYHPEKDNIKKDFFKTAQADWIKRTKKPFFDSLKEAKYMYMAREGAIFFKTPSQPIGSVSKLFNRNKQLGLDEPIYRIGKAFLIGNKI